MKREFESEGYTISELKEEVIKQHEKKEILEKEIPRNVSIGAFNVNVEKLRKFLINKRQRVADSLLKMHAKNLKNRAHEVLNEFNSIWFKLVKQPENIEEIFEIREWMESLQMTVADIVEILQKLKIDYDILDQFNWNLSNEDVDDKWSVFKYPFRIQNQV